jgi:hypothetical protein
MEKEKFTFITPQQQNEAIEIFIDRGGAKEAEITEDDILDFMKENVRVYFNDRREIVDLEW